MSVAKVIEIISSSKLSFDDAVKHGLAKASETIKGISGAWVKDQRVVADNGKVVEYRVVMKVTFVLESPAKAAAKSSKRK
jgi:dodecin